jgi:iron complex outermembrane recepter protein
MRSFTLNVLYNDISIGPQSITSRVMDTGNLDRVEFLKGPSSLMSGLDAIGGSVNYVTKQPTSGPIQNELDASFDSLGTIRSHFGSGGTTAMQAIDYRFDVFKSKINSFIEGDYQDLTGLSAGINYHATSTFNAFAAIEYKKDWGIPTGALRWFRSRLPAPMRSVASSPVPRSTPSMARSLGRSRRTPRTLTSNYNVLDNSTGAEELWFRSGFEWIPTSDLTVRNQFYYYQARRHWIDSETYAFNLATSMIDRDRFSVTHNQHLVGDNTDLIWNSRPLRNGESLRRSTSGKQKLDHLHTIG